MTAYRRFAQQVYDWNSRLGPNADPTPFQSCLLLSSMQSLNLFCLAKVLPLPAALDPFGTTMGIFLVLAFVTVANGFVFRTLRAPGGTVRWTDAVPGLREFPVVYAYIALTMGFLLAVAFLRD